MSIPVVEAKAQPSGVPTRSETKSGPPYSTCSAHLGSGLLSRVSPKVQVLGTFEVIDISPSNLDSSLCFI